MKQQLKGLFVLFLIATSNFIFAQFEIPPKPKEQTSIYDYYGLLNSKEKNALESKLIRYSDSTSTQIVIAIIASTEGEYINYLGAQWGEEWGIGQEKEDNGILILLARDDRKIGINTGDGIEPYLTDALSKRIINRDIIPYFKNNDYYGGLDRGTDAIFEVLNGTYKGSRDSNNGGSPVGFIFILILFIIIIIALSKSKGGGSGGRRRRSGGLLEAIILSNMGRGSYSSGSGGFGGGSFGGGGFGGGFGGGGFSGGGASGGW